MTQPAQRAKLGTARSCCCHVTNPQKITMFFLLPAPFEKKVIPLKGIPEAQASLQLGFETSKRQKNGAAQGVCFETQISWENPARCQRKKIWILGVTIAIFGA